MQSSGLRGLLYRVSKSSGSLFQPCTPARCSAIPAKRHRSSLRDPTQPIPYQDLIVGCPKEASNDVSPEKRVALTPSNAALLKKKGFRVQVATQAGQLAGFSDEAYIQAGADIVSQDALMGESDIVLRVRRPDTPDVHQLKPGASLISMIYPKEDDPLLKDLSKRSITALGLELIPRISRAQSMDVLSSMANIAGYRAVIEAANEFGRSINSATTAAGSTPPAKTLVIGAGVAGLSAITTAKRLGAIVRGFDTRAAAKEQVESLGAEFLTVDIKEEGDAGTGYAKQMSKVRINYNWIPASVLSLLLHRNF